MVVTRYFYRMNEAKVPQNNKHWQAMDIYLFSNGQQNSPPRKYHLQIDELQFWQTTIHHLAHSQYGPMHSTIDLYTLDGKRIESPLELIDSASYVAVTPPDAFIHAGYEQYLIKASRSWERRQEKIINMGNGAEVKIDQSKIATDESRMIETTPVRSINDKDQDSIGTNNTIISRLKKENATSIDDPAAVKTFPSRKSAEIEKNRSIRKSTPASKTNSKDDTLMKKRNISVFRTPKHVPNKRQSLKNDQNLNKSNNSKVSKELEASLIKPTEDTEVKDTIMLSKPEDLHSGYQSREASKSGFDKGIIVISDVYKNPESEVQSVFIDADQKKAARDYPKDKFKSSDFQRIVELEELDNTMKNSKATSTQSVGLPCYGNRPEITSSLSTKGKVFNIKLNIELRDNRDSTSEDKNCHLMKCKSFTELLRTEQESQANIDIHMNCDNLKTHVDVLPRKSMLFEKSYLCDSNDPKLSMVQYGMVTCGVDGANTIGNGKENYILFVPAMLLNEDQCCRCKPVTNQNKEKDGTKRRSITTTDVIDIKGNPVSRENSQVTIKHKVSICPDSPVKISAENPSSFEKDSININPSTDPSQKPIKVPTKDDKFAQTDWGNVLLQAFPQGNGLFSFHLPPLRVLAQYNLL